MDNPGKLYSTSGDSWPSGDFTSSDGRITIAGFEVSIIQEIGGALVIHSEEDVEGQKLTYNADVKVALWLESIRHLLSQSGISEFEQKDPLMRIAAADLYRSTTGDVERIQDEGIGSFSQFYKLLWGSLRHITSEDARLRSTSLGYQSAMLCAGRGRRPFLSSDNRVDLAPESAAVGDVITVFYGSDVPFVLRLDKNGRHRLLGEAYVHGIMDGELMAQNTWTMSQKFTLC